MILIKNFFILLVCDYPIMYYLYQRIFKMLKKKKRESHQREQIIPTLNIASFKYSHYWIYIHCGQRSLLIKM